MEFFQVSVTVCRKNRMSDALLQTINETRPDIANQITSLDHMIYIHLFNLFF